MMVLSLKLLDVKLVYLYEEKVTILSNNVENYFSQFPFKKKQRKH